MQLHRTKELIQNDIKQFNWQCLLPLSPAHISVILGMAPIGLQVPSWEWGTLGWRPSPQYRGIEKWGEGDASTPHPEINVTYW